MKSLPGLLVLSGFLLLPPTASGQTAAAGPVYTKDVAPILQRACQHCHRPESIAPMALMSYEDVRPFARAIRSQDEGALFCPNQHSYFAHDKSA